MIKSNYSKTKAVVKFKAGTYDKERLREIWYLLFTKQLLVRVTVGINNYELLYERNKYSTRILDLPENTNEMLLQRQIKRTVAKALHIFRNSNDNNMRSATIFFENQEDLANSFKYAVYYNNSKLRWTNLSEQVLDITSKYIDKEYKKIGTQQERSAKSLGKRREDEQEQISECSKAIQNRSWSKEKSKPEIASTDTEDYISNQSEAENSGIEFYKQKEEEYYRKKNSANNKK